MAVTDNPLRNIQEYIRLPLLFDHWYVAGLASEFDRSLRAKTLLERSVVMYRREDGGLVALQNRCVHRSFPLADSRLEGDNIRCGYHGILYNPRGHILEVPCQDHCPGRQLRRYPVAERGPLVWIWMGEPDAADETRIPETDCLSAADWTAMWAARDLDGNYLLMHENLADLSHLPFLHEKTFGAAAGWASIPVQVEREGDCIHYWRETGDWAMAAPFYPPGLDLAGRPVHCRLGASFVSPAMCRGWNDVTLLDASAGEQPVLRNEINHYLTPATHDSAHYFWSFARNSDIHNEAYSKRFFGVVDTAFDEDRVATRAMQRVLDQDRHDFAEMNIAGDRSSIAVRRVILELVAREQATAAA